MTIDIADFDGVRRTVKTLDEGTFLVANPDTTQRIGRLSNFIYYEDSTAAIAGGATLTTTGRDSGFGTSTPTVFSKWKGFVLLDQACTIRVQGGIATSGTVWRDLTMPITGLVVAANTPTFIEMPLLFRLFRMLITNTSGTATTITQVNSGFSI